MHYFIHRLHLSGLSPTAALIFTISLAFYTTGLYSQGFEAVAPLTPFSVSKNSGERPQSKVWKYDGKWWSVFPNSSGTFLWKLEENTWKNVLKLSGTSVVKADCKPVNDVCHVLLWRTEEYTSLLVSLEYDRTSGNYKLWSARPSVTNIYLDPGVETATIDIDANGRMWLASDGVNDIRARWSDPPYTTWSTPIVIASNVTDDDIAAVISLPLQGQVGIFWSNQTTRRWGFRTHSNGANASQWSNDEVPVSQSALNIGSGMADDHLNLAVASDGSLYCAVKTGYDTPGYPQVALLKRRPNGAWDNLYGVADVGTKPIVIINDATDLIKVVFSKYSGDDILYRESRLSDISFSSTKILMDGIYDNATSSKDNYQSEVVILASDNVNRQVVGVIAKDPAASDVPASPELLTPANFSTDQPLNPYLGWGSAANANSYRIQVSAVSDFSVLIYDKSNVTGTSTQDSTTLANDTRYYWRVRAENSYGSSAWSNSWSFTTIPPAPDVPLLLSPSNQTETEDNTLKWNSADHADSFHLQFALAANFSTTIIDQSGIADTTYSLGGLVNGETYYWRVSAANVSGTSGWSATWSFTAKVTSSVQGLAGFWKLDEGAGTTINDDSGNGNNGACISFPSWATGVTGSALVLDGLDQYARVPDAPSLDIEDEITLAAWVKPAKRSSQKIIAKGDSKIADGYELSLLSTGKASFRINQNTSETYKINSTTLYPIDGTWMHIAATFKATNMKIFVNGLENKSLTFSAPTSLGSNTLPLVIGAATDETSNFQGSIDDVRIYNYVLPASEIYALANSSGEKQNATARLRTENIQIYKEQVLQNQIRVFPNPTDNMLLVGLTPGKQNIISISDMNGRVLYRTVCAGENNEITIDLGGFHLQKGVYLLCIQSSDSIEKTKFIKK